ncbi:transcriptional regulator [Desulfoluna limicola]|uniref:Transcriptional regulator n=1 Tax=Desulfoluna limicola TaxID=2810562 RepID=A0ABN6F013_9BACT|nr:winged helix-turn-helix domain-containing protein [Desulfoluna limicola]BCS94672.1 transcriptional regulator [Desulfoluna limicola]
MGDLLSGIIGSKTRIKLLVRLFFNPDTHAYLRELAAEFGVSTNAVREELNQLSQADLLTSSKNGRQIHYTANQKHPLFPELRSMVRKAIGVDKIIDSIVTRLGDLEAAYLIDDYAEGKDTGIIDLVLVGNIDPYHLNDLSRKTERYINRKIRSLVMTKDEYDDFQENLKRRPMVLVWQATNAESS